MVICSDVFKAVCVHAVISMQIVIYADFFWFAKKSPPKVVTFFWFAIKNHPKKC